MKILDFILGGANFAKTKYGKVGDIIYPANNNTNGWFCKSRWDLVLEVDETGYITHRRHIWDYETVDAIECIEELRNTKRSSPGDKKS